MASPPAFIALSVAGTDPTGGAGLSRDLETFAAHGVSGRGVVAAVTAQDGRGVRAVFAVPADVVAAQIDAACADGLPAAVKTGMLFSPGAAAAVADAVVRHGLHNLVVDPVLAASAGGSLAEPGLLAVLRERLFPLAALVTPNRPEAEALLGRPVPDGSEEEAALALRRALGCAAVLVKGGHGRGEATDALATAGGAFSFSLPRLDVPPARAHGTGCALSAAVAALLARGTPLPDAVRGAKQYVHAHLRSGTVSP